MVFNNNRQTSSGKYNSKWTLNPDMSKLAFLTMATLVAAILSLSMLAYAYASGESIPTDPNGPDRGKNACCAVRAPDNDKGSNDNGEGGGGGGSIHHSGGKIGKDKQAIPQ
jgi:hypothetical protein